MDGAIHFIVCCKKGEAADREESFKYTKLFVKHKFNE